MTNELNSRGVDLNQETKDREMREKFQDTT